MGLESLIHNSSQKLFLPGEVVGGVYGIKVHHILSLVTLQRSGFAPHLTYLVLEHLGELFITFFPYKKKVKHIGKHRRVPYP